ncbi:MAG: N-acetylmuramoyl-L-alanine amidase [Candidatus Gastranaerophilales bacterium]|nr:N-acetylmuramoyl-L-alanine amidase [Candidatus Gastranaerophilales bacterium]
MVNSKDLTLPVLKSNYSGKKISEISETLKKSNMSIVDTNNNGIFDAADGIQYKVKKGDTLYKIAKENGLKIKDLTENNKNINPNKIKVNDSLWLQKGKPVKNEKKPAAPKPKPHYEYNNEGDFELPTAIAKTQQNNNIADANKKVVMIDIGHGEKDPGAVCPFDKSTTESKINEKAAGILKTKLEELGYAVHIGKNRGGGVKGRAQRVNEKKAINPDYYLSIHTNAGSAKANGEEVCYRNPEDKEFANTIAASMKKDNTFASRNNGKAILRDKLQVLGKAYLDTKNALIELGFISNKSDCEKLTDTETLEKQVEAIAMGVASYDATESYRNSSMIALNK